MTEMSHLSENTAEPGTDPILFFTPFNYLFPTAAREPDCLLDVSKKTVQGLVALGEAMGDPGSTSKGSPNLNSKIPSIFTYLGQFIDHDLTIRTDGDGTVTMIEKQDAIVPIAPDTIVAKLKNGRRPFLDLDSLYGDGPSLAKAADAENSSQKLYDKSYKFHLHVDNYDLAKKHAPLDLHRIKEQHGTPAKDEPRALIADERNDENINISQLHASFLHLHNTLMRTIPKHPGGSTEVKKTFIKARQLVRWTYQFIVANQYLPLVCDSLVVEDTLVNGPRFLGTAKEHSGVFMPLEFSVAAFRFGHTMIRPTYQLNSQTEKDIMDILLPSHINPKTGALKVPFTSTTPPVLDESFQIDWRNYLDFGGTPPVNVARKIDPLLATGLFDLPTADRQKSPTLKHLAISNLLRGYSLSIPTGQAACRAFGLAALSPSEILKSAKALDKETKSKTPLAPVLEDNCFHEKTPLWFYVLLEAHAQREGKKLGALGGRILCETLIGLLKSDPNSYLNCDDDRITDAGISLPEDDGGNRTVGRLQDMLGYTGLIK